MANEPLSPRVDWHSQRRTSPIIWSSHTYATTPNVHSDVLILEGHQESLWWGPERVLLLATEKELSTVPGAAHAEQNSLFTFPWGWEQAGYLLAQDWAAGRSLQPQSERLVLIFGIQKVPEILSHVNSDSHPCFFFNAGFLAWNSAAQILRAAYPPGWNCLERPLQVPWFWNALYGFL